MGRLVFMTPAKGWTAALRTLFRNGRHRNLLCHLWNFTLVDVTLVNGTPLFYFLKQ